MDYTLSWTHLLFGLCWAHLLLVKIIFMPHQWAGYQFFLMKMMVEVSQEKITWYWYLYPVFLFFRKACWENCGRSMEFSDFLDSNQSGFRLRCGVGKCAVSIGWDVRWLLCLAWVALPLFLRNPRGVISLNCYLSEDLFYGGVPQATTVFSPLLYNVWISRPLGGLYGDMSSVC